MFTKWRKNL